MKMEEVIINRYLKMFDLLDIETKLELLVRLSDNVNRSFKRAEKDKADLLDSISGSWSDVDDRIVEEIYTARTLSNREVDLGGIDE